MNVICTEASGSTALTLGKTYAVVRSHRDKFVIRNDRGRESGYFKKRFMPAPKPEPAKPEGHQWDASRGPQMASPTGRTIFKYPVPSLEDFHLSLPQGAQIIRIDHIDGFTWAWAVVDLRQPCTRRRFRAFKTGATIPDTFDTSSYVGFYPIFVQQELGLYVFEDKA